MQIAAMGLGSSSYSILVLGISTVIESFVFTRSETIAFWAFYLPTWEEYHTGVLYLGYINGPTEGLLLAISMMIISGFAGPAIWQRTFSDQLPSLFSNTIVEDIVIIDASIFCLGTIFFILYVPTCLFAVRSICQARSSSFKIALMQLAPMALMSISALVWLWSPYSHIRRDGKFSLFVLTFGVTFSRMATKIIYAHLTKLPFPYYSGLEFPLFVGAFFINLPAILPALAGIVTPKGELIFLWIWFLFTAVGYINWCFHVIRSFCEYLDIYCFAIKARTH